MNQEHAEKSIKPAPSIRVLKRCKYSSTAQYLFNII